MLIQGLLIIATLIIVIGILIRLLKPDWRETYLICVGILFAIPIGAAIVLYRILRSIIGLLWFFAKPIGKAMLFIIVAIILIPVTLITSFVPHIGSKSKSFNKLIMRTIGVSKWGSGNRLIRSTIVEIAASDHDRKLEFEREEEYREAFQQVKEQGKRKLAVGESALTIFVGVVLLASQVTGFSLLQSRIYGVSVTLGIQVILLFIALSIVYRVSILEFLAYSGGEEFESIPEMDAALSYQKLVSNIAFIQLLNFLLVIGIWMVNIDRHIIREAIKDYSGNMTMFNTLKRVYGKMNKQNDDEN